MSTSVAVQTHVILSRIGIGPALVVLGGMLGSRALASWTALTVLAAAIVARYGRRLAGAWRWIYVVAAVVALSLNLFVGLVQDFEKIAFLHRLAPTHSEPPFVIAQLVLLAIFVVLGALAVRRFRPAAAGRVSHRA